MTTHALDNDPRLLQIPAAATQQLRWLGPGSRWGFWFRLSSRTHSTLLGISTTGFTP
jgi:hypothetical protein